MSVSSASLLLQMAEAAEGLQQQRKLPEMRAAAADAAEGLQQAQQTRPRPHGIQRWPAAGPPLLD